MCHCHQTSIISSLPAQCSLMVIIGDGDIGESYVSSAYWEMRTIRFSMTNPQIHKQTFLVSDEPDTLVVATSTN